MYTAHPRSRGENSKKTAGGMGNRGSSPLTRGKRPPPRCRLRNDRLIPAHAGKTPLRRRRQGPGAAHPRSRGENNIEAIADQAYIGSSPLTRGKRHHAHEVRQRGRLIPAHAGKTQEFNQAILDLGAHPRSRGENWKLTWRQPPRRGSSPLTRGEQCCRYGDRYPSRLIPAHAGKTLVADTAQVAGTAHPRSRGENSIDQLAGKTNEGSSPLTRGKLL